MGAARYVGRVGGLAVALGVGAAVLTGTAVAWADEGGAGSSASSSSASSSTSSRAEQADPSGASGGAAGPSKVGTSSSAGDSDTETETSKSTSSGSNAAGADDAKAVDDGVDTSSPSLSKRDKAVRAQAAKINKAAEAEAAEAEADEAGAKAAAAAGADEQGPEPEDTPDVTEPAKLITLDPVDAPVVEKAPVLDDTIEAVTPTPVNVPLELVPEPAETAVADPVAPAGGASLVGVEGLLGAARRETIAEKLPYSPTIDVDNGVITGTNNGAIVTPGNLELSFNVIGKTAAGGKVNMDQITGDFTFLPFTADALPSGTDSFRVLIAQKTFVVRLLESIPVIKYLVNPIVVVLHRIPIVNVLLSPIIGRSRIERVDIDVSQLVADYQNPIAFTTKVVSFDGIPISVNYFPAVGLLDGQVAPTILNGPSLATAGYTDTNQVTTVFGLVPGLKTLRVGYNVITWDPRGEFASGGRMHLDSELFEARDVSSIITWMSGLETTKYGPGRDGVDDPLIGMVGGSYGGGIQLTSAGIDRRIDAIAPGIAWNTLNDALYPNHGFKTAWASLLLASLVSSGARLDPEIYAGITTGVLFGFLTPRQQHFLSRNSPETVVGNIDIPTLFLQGTVDTLFPLDQAIANASALNPDVPVKMIWYCGGHGDCLTMNKDQLAAQTDFLVGQTMAWMDTYVANKQSETPPPVVGPKFEWVDQNGDWYNSANLPLNPDVFNGPSITAAGGGGLLPIGPFFGSGPQWKAFFPVSLTSGARTWPALNVTVPQVAETAYIVGAPQLTFSYSGLGTSRNVYAQLVDKETGLVLGNIVSSIPVKLDGQRHTVQVSMEYVAYTMKPGDTLILQIVDSAAAFEDFTSFGVISISDVALSLPTAVNVMSAVDPVPVGVAAAV